jgi:hypothetical protein
LNPSLVALSLRATLIEGSFLFTNISHDWIFILLNNNNVLRAAIYTMTRKAWAKPRLADLINVKMKGYKILNIIFASVCHCFCGCKN